ncbi:hypothetical protein [Oceanisphaera profunda]|uniref:hypothetical protein n=1 Tax=Oceanisphaera profunda TaxID=1416627 RepID=UPI001D130A33|nr:hypothetical protein [Oceanisphaera profunda]
MLSPLRFGAGIKGKLLDAMIMQTPNITTAIGSEGMHGERPWPGAIVEIGMGAEGAQAFADAAVALYQDEVRWQQAQLQGTALLKQRYDSEPLGEQLISRITELASQLDAHRLANFTGSMLRHHSMMSTKYMSQWITAKNAGAPKD